MSETRTADAPAVPAMPPTLGGVIPYLTVDGALKASAFYQEAFDAREVFAYPPDDKGRTMHVHLYLNGSSVMLGDAGRGNG
jgi:PhnB protein